MNAAAAGVGTLAAGRRLAMRNGRLVAAPSLGPEINLKQIRHIIARPFIKKNWDSVAKLTKAPRLAMQHFDSLYCKVYGNSWPSARLGLLSPKKQCAVTNSFVDQQPSPEEIFGEDYQPIDLHRYYKKHQLSYTRWHLRQQILANKRARKRELLALSSDVDPETIDIDQIEVSDVSDSELRGAQSTDASDAGGFSTAEDLFAMFSDQRMDDNERYFINKASTQLSLNDYMPTTEMIIREDTPNEGAYFDFEPSQKLDVPTIEQRSLELDKQLRIYTFPRNDWTRFPPPSRDPQSQLHKYYLLDGASVLAVLALEPTINDICADYCAAPGGKAITLLMSLKPQHLLCNDSSQSRLLRLSKVIREYAPDISYVRSTLRLSRQKAQRIIHPDGFDKILVDVPCSNDRLSSESLENNIFKTSRNEERLLLPQIQCNILIAALKSVRVKGTVVYSTCTMSPYENDGVVQRALLQLQEDNFPSKFAVVNLKEAFRPLRGLFKFKTDFLYGQQVLPNVCSNFGPMYISKIKRLE